MKKSLAFTAFTIALSLSFWSTTSWAFAPDWQLAGTWQVEVVYPIAGKTDAWTAPIVWHYRVAAKDQDSVTLAVSRNTTGTEAMLRYRRSDLTLSSIEYVKKLRGTDKTFMESFAAGLPVSSDAFLAPYDTPVFPLQSPDHQEFTSTQTVAGLKTVGTLVQEVVTATTLPEAAGSTSSGPFLKVTCTRNGAEMFVQYWQTGQPWPVYGENRNMRYWLVHHE